MNKTNSNNKWMIFALMAGLYSNKRNQTINNKLCRAVEAGERKFRAAFREMGSLDEAVLQF